MRVMTVGCWDLLHVGHTNLFRRCLELARYEHFFIGVNTDRFMLEYKHVIPHDSEEVRMRNVGVFGKAFLHDDDMLKDLIQWRPNYLVVGSDWHTKDYHAQIKMSQRELDELNVAVVYVPATKGISSTALRAERAKCSCGGLPTGSAVHSPNWCGGVA